MLYGNRTDNREVFFTAWQKFLNSEPLDHTETEIVQLINQHPEYHYIFNDPSQYLDKDFVNTGDETNPFMHLAIHLTISEQVRLDRPQGIRSIYQSLLKKYSDAHQVDHMIMEVLIEQLWQVMHYQQAFAEEQYLEELNKLVVSPSS